ncbi:hypothetical protein NFI95_15525 [Acetobacteraceae bacterium KSS8]|uniref:Phage late control D family protein n=1 Tax=Endosaccharibacter trunci TaxID=2812733 RepID=A0ABT1WAD9_9PROT|nr:hypothetical protein [Acetobacteraceae bacterium KSS8]
MSETITATAKAPPSTGTRPRGRILIGGVQQAGTSLKSFRCERSRYGRGDTFSADLALTAGGAIWYDPKEDQNGEIADIDVQIQMGFLADGAPEGSCAWTTVFQGIIDTLGPIEPHRAMASISGRDYLAKLRDLAVAEAYLNHTATEILQSLITAAGLTPDVQMPTGLDGAFYQIEHKRLALIGNHRFSSGFDLARFLVNAANCDMWAHGKTVRVRPRGSSTKSTTLTYVPPGALSYAKMPVTNLSLERDLLIGKGVVVQVSTRDVRQRATHTWYWSAKGASRTAPSTANAQVYAFSPPGLTDDAAKAYAQARYNEIVAHGRTVAITMPGDLSLGPRQSVQLVGTGTSWDQTYSIDALERSLSMESGFTQTLTLRNRLTEADAE